MGYTKDDFYALFFGTANNTFADSTSYLFGNVVYLGAETTVSKNKVYVPRAGTVRAGSFIFFANNAQVGTAEDIVMTIRKNDTTDYTFATVGTSSSVRLFENYALNIPVASGDYLTMKVTCPAWVTNPLAVYINGNLFVSY